MSDRAHVYPERLDKDSEDDNCKRLTADVAQEKLVR